MIAEAPNIHQELKENVEVIDRNVKSAKNIIRNFLDFSNLGNRDTEKVFIQDLIFESIEFVTLIAKNKKVVIETSAPSDDYYLVGNEVQIKQVFINILMNAFQAFEKKSRSIKINSFYDDQENELEIRFINNGPKIPKEIQEHIFESFFTTKKRENGTGLGLSTARRILETYKGSILLESSNNQETTFSVRLPALRVQKNFNFEEKKPESDDFQYAE